MRKEYGEMLVKLQDLEYHLKDAHELFEEDVEFLDMEEELEELIKDFGSLMTNLKADILTLKRLSEEE